MRYRSRWGTVCFRLKMAWCGLRGGHGLSPRRPQRKDGSEEWHCWRCTWSFCIIRPIQGERLRGQELRLSYLDEMKP